MKANSKTLVPIKLHKQVVYIFQKKKKTSIITKNDTDICFCFCFFHFDVGHSSYLHISCPSKDSNRLIYACNKYLLRNRWIISTRYEIKAIPFSTGNLLGSARAVITCLTK